MPSNTPALAEKVEALRAEILELRELTEPTEEQNARFSAALDEFDVVKAEYDKSAERDAKIDAIREAQVSGKVRTEPAFHVPNVVVKRDAFDDLASVERGLPAAEMTARAVTAIEDTNIRGFSDERKARAVELAEEDPSIARHILLAGSPAYMRAFSKVLRNPEMGLALLDGEEREAMRAALSNTSANGGFSLPVWIDPTIILTNDGTANPFRQISTVFTGTTDKWNGLTSAGVTASWLAEGTEATDASPTVAQPSITAFKAAAYVFSSYEQESDGQLVSQLPLLFRDAKDRLESTAFATGNGTTAPEGVATGVGAVTASRVSPTTGGTFTSASIADVFKVANALTPRSIGNASWAANRTILNTIRQQAMAQNSANSIWTDMAVGVPNNLLGAPVYEASAMTGTVTTSSDILVAGDFKAGYYIYDRVGMELKYNPIVVGSNQRPTGQSGWFAFWRVGAKVVDPNEFRLLRL